MNAKQIQRHLIRQRWHANFVVPNYTPSNWWECDLFEVTKAGYFKEYEIKVTLKDFRADTDKRKVKVEWDKPSAPGEKWARREVSLDSKHQMLAKSHPHGPSQFWFVCPEDVIPVRLLPAWAGLVYVTGSGQHLHEREIVKAPRLHNHKPGDAIVAHARGVFYYRYYRAMFERDYYIVDETESVSDNAGSLVKG